MVSVFHSLCLTKTLNTSQILWIIELNWFPSCTLPGMILQLRALFLVSAMLEIEYATQMHCLKLFSLLIKVAVAINFMRVF